MLKVFDIECTFRLSEDCTRIITNRVKYTNKVLCFPCKMLKNRTRARERAQALKKAAP